MKILFLFGYIKSHSSDSEGSTKVDFVDIFEIEKTDPTHMISLVREELERLILQNKLKKTLKTGVSEDLFSSFEEFFGEFRIPKKNGGPEDREFIMQLNQLFRQELPRIFDHLNEKIIRLKSDQTFPVLIDSSRPDCDIYYDGKHFYSQGK
jgi:hypothetical protein